MPGTTLQPPPASRPRLLGALLLIVWAAVVPFLPVLGNGFVDFDDDVNFTRNLDFRGVAGANLRWALGTDVVGVY